MWLAASRMLLLSYICGMQLQASYVCFLLADSLMVACGPECQASASLARVVLEQPPGDDMASVSLNLSIRNPCPEDPALDGPPINYSRPETIAIVLVLVVIMVITLAGNSLVIASVLLFRQMRSLTNYFVLSLAVADILVASLVMPFGAYNIYTNLEWTLGSTMCKVASCFDVMLTTASILHLLCLAMDRYYAICNPFFYHQRITKRTVTVLLLACWTIPIILAWIPIMNDWSAIGIESTIECRTPEDGRACVFLVNIPFAIFGSTIAFYAPAIFMVLVNVRIYGEAKRQALQIRSLEMTALDSEHKQDKNMKQERKAAKTLSVIMGAFCGCWCPFFIFNVLDPVLGYKIPFTAWQLALWLGYVNSTINPFLYYFFNRKFRRAFIRVLLCHRCRGIGETHDAMITALSNVSEWLVGLRHSRLTKGSIDRRSSGRKESRKGTLSQIMSPDDDVIRLPGVTKRTSQPGVIAATSPLTPVPESTRSDIEVEEKSVESKEPQCKTIQPTVSFEPIAKTPRFNLDSPETSMGSSSLPNYSPKHSSESLPSAQTSPGPRPATIVDSSTPPLAQSSPVEIPRRPSGKEGIHSKPCSHHLSKDLSLALSDSPQMNSLHSARDSPLSEGLSYRTAPESPSISRTQPTYSSAKQSPAISRDNSSAALGSPPFSPKGAPAVAPNIGSSVQTTTSPVGDRSRTSNEDYSIKSSNMVGVSRSLSPSSTLRTNARQDDSNASSDASSKVANGNLSRSNKDISETER